MNSDWRSLGNCLDVDPDLFFPHGTDSSPTGREQVAQAKDICAPCPVTLECLTSALIAGDEGVRGGTTYTERRALHGRTPA